jgi:3-phenylpropionate/trans-cinnamate dioxygenase ferredoxin reductase subunit
MTAPIVIVGGGLAAGTAATTLRECGYGGDVVVFADESHPPYERPPLSKAYLRGQVEAESTYLHPQSWYAGNNVDLRTSSRVDAIDIETRRVQSSGAEMPYSKLLLVTGSRARLYPILGTEHVTVQYLRTLDDAARLKSAFVSGRRMLVVGGGWIGMEVAASARQFGLEVPSSNQLRNL